MNKRTTSDCIADVRTELLKHVDYSYYREAPEEKTFPYVVFDVRPMGDDMMVVELDMWAKRPNQISLLDTANEIEAALDGFIIDSPAYTLALFSNNDGKWLIDEDKDFLHFNLSFNGVYQS